MTGTGGTHLESQHLGGRQISEFKATLVYKVSSRTARSIQRNPVSKNKTKQNKQTNKELFLKRKENRKREFGVMTLWVGILPVICMKM